MFELAETPKQIHDEPFTSYDEDVPCAVTIMNWVRMF